MFKMSRCMYDVLASNRDAAAVVVAPWWIFGPILYHFLVSFPCAGSARSTIVTPIGVILSLWCVLLIPGAARRRKRSPFWGPFRHQNRQRRWTNVKKQGPAQQTKKSSISEATQGGPLCRRDSKYHMSESVADVHLDDFGVTWGSHLEPLWDTLPVQSPNLSVTGVPKKHSPKKR